MSSQQYQCSPYYTPHFAPSNLSCTIVWQTPSPSRFLPPSHHLPHPHPHPYPLAVIITAASPLPSHYLCYRHHHLLKSLESVHMCEILLRNESAVPMASLRLCLSSSEFIVLLSDGDKSYTHKNIDGDGDGDGDISSLRPLGPNEERVLQFAIRATRVGLHNLEWLFCYEAQVSQHIITITITITSPSPSPSPSGEPFPYANATVSCLLPCES